MTSKQCLGHQTYNENVDPKQGYNSLRDLTLTVSEKKATYFFFKQGNMSDISLYARKKEGILMMYLT